MNDITQPNRQRIAAQDRSSPGKVTGKLARAIDYMVFDGMKRKEAAKAAGMSLHGIEAALVKPHVRAHYAERLKLLRTCSAGRMFHRLIEIAEQDDNLNAAVSAAKVVLGGVDHNAPAAVATAGFTIVIGNQDREHPVIEGEKVRDERNPDETEPDDPDT